MGAVPSKRLGKPKCDSPCRAPRACTVVTAESGSRKAGRTLLDHQGLRAVERGLKKCRGFPTALEDGNCISVLPGRLLTSSSWSFCGRGPKEGERFPNRPKAPRHPSLLGIGNPDIDKAVDSRLEEEGMLPEYQELSLLSVV